MQIDLAQAGTDPATLTQSLQARVCVIGAGIAGILVAHRLAQAGVRSVLLEAGGMERWDSSSSTTFAADLTGQPHAGTRDARVRAFGGTSLTWGGQLLPLPDDAAWPGPRTELHRYELEARSVLGLRGSPPGPEELPDSVSQLVREMTARWSEFLPFSKRNLGQTLGKNLLADPHVTVILHAPVAELQVIPKGDRVTAAVVRTPQGPPLTVTADHFVLAAGTVETCRLLLASRSVDPEGIGNRQGQVGLNFHDHLTITAATLHEPARSHLLQSLGPRIARHAGQGVVRSLKLEPGTHLRATLGANAAMAHITVEEPEHTGIGAVRRWMRERQSSASGHLPLRQLPSAIFEAIGWIWTARVHGRRYVSPRATVRLQLNLAQDTPSRSRVLLSNEARPDGTPRPILDWEISPQELASLRAWTRLLHDRLTAAGLGEGAQWEPALLDDGSEADARLRTVLEDARHAMGGACMGTDPRSSVVDPALRVHGVPNLSLASAATFPDGSAQLPTLTLAALSLRLADRLASELS